MIATATRADVYTRVNKTIIKLLEQGVKPRFCSWNAKHAAGGPSRPLRFNGEGYRGINVLMLWAASVEAGYACPIWLTFNQAKQLGGSVRKGEKSSLVVYASSFKKDETNTQTSETFEHKIPLQNRQYIICTHSSPFESDHCFTLWGDCPRLFPCSFQAHHQELIHVYNFVPDSYEQKQQHGFTLEDRETHSENRAFCQAIFAA